MYKTDLFFNILVQPSLHFFVYFPIFFWFIALFFRLYISIAAKLRAHIVFSTFSIIMVQFQRVSQILCFPNFRFQAILVHVLAEFNLY